MHERGWSDEGSSVVAKRGNASPPRIRRVVLSATGLPERITSFFTPEVTGIEDGPGREILAGPIGQNPQKLSRPRA